MCPWSSSPRLLQLFIEHEATIRTDTANSEMVRRKELCDDFDISLVLLMDSTLRMPVAGTMSALLDDYNASRHASLCEFPHLHLRLCRKIEISYRDAIVQESVNSETHLLESLENQVRNDINHTHKSKTYKLFGPAHLTTNRLVMAHAIKINCKDKPFRLAWLQMSNQNGGNTDPFHHSEVTLQNFLRMQGLLRGPAISHFPVKMSTKNWSE